VFYANRKYGELYNLMDDPDEIVNLWDEPSYAELKSELIRMLLDWSVFATDGSFREWNVPTNKGEYTNYLRDSADTMKHYLPKSKWKGGTANPPRADK